MNGIVRLMRKNSIQLSFSAHMDFFGEGSRSRRERDGFTEKLRISLPFSSRLPVSQALAPVASPPFQTWPTEIEVNRRREP